jgi:hypothetical protein
VFIAFMSPPYAFQSTGMSRVNMDS